MEERNTTDIKIAYQDRLADEVLAQLTKIADSAKEELNKCHTGPADTFASLNTMTYQRSMNNDASRAKANRDAYKTLAAEPSIARVVALQDDGRKRTFYICRAMPVSGITDLVSYRAPVGSLATKFPGESFTMTNGIGLRVLERENLKPSLLPEGWDSKVEAHALDFETFTIESLLQIQKATAKVENPQDLLSQFLDEEKDVPNVFEGIRREVITKMALRDQPILDKYQDEIFRLPLNTRLVLVGPPGTGKTTTLIRRLGQKLDIEYLEADEKLLVESIVLQHEHPIKRWLMFTPTDLLKHYLKEAFSIEGVPASDLQIRTWSDHRRDLARNAFRILKTSSGSGSLVIDENLQSLERRAIDDPISWFNEFDSWQSETFFSELESAVKGLSTDSPDVQDIGQKLDKILASNRKRSIPARLLSFASVRENVKDLLSKLNEESETIMRTAINVNLNRDRSFLDELSRYVVNLKTDSSEDLEESTEMVNEDEGKKRVSGSAKTEAFNAYKKAIRAMANALVSKTTLNPETRNWKIIKWLGDRVPSETDLARVGKNIQLHGVLTQFENPASTFLKGISIRYRKYREQNLHNKTWYKPKDPGREIHPLEIDIILLAILSLSSELANRSNALQDPESPINKAIRPYIGEMAIQILVDEMSDFSPIQLACMKALAHPRLRSFFSCGDFNQRLTAWGTRSGDDLKWILGEFDYREISFSYRQSKHLRALSQAIINGSSEAPTMAEQSPYENVGVPPVLKENIMMEDVAYWLAERIIEIETFLGQLPSIAIFVNSEQEVPLLAEKLRIELRHQNIQVFACKDGQAIGQTENVRVFDIQHIKGLEFEAAFFVDLDLLASLHPELFDKYLYVGATRAATYLGITCHKMLPQNIESLRHHFVDSFIKG